LTDSPDSPEDGADMMADALARVTAGEAERVEKLRADIRRELDAATTPEAWSAIHARAAVRMATVRAPGSEPAPARRSLSHFITEMEETKRRRIKGEDRPIPTPWDGVNERLRGGFWPGLYTVTSSTGAGKTQWALQCAVHAAERFATDVRRGAEREKGASVEEILKRTPTREPDRVLYIALELGGAELAARTFSCVDPKQGWSDLLYSEDIDEMAFETICQGKARRRLDLLPFDVEVADAMGWTWQSLAALEHEPRPPRFIVIDYTQLARAPENVREELRITIGNIARVARNLARKRGITTLAICSTARANYDKVAGTRPKGTTKPGPAKEQIKPGEFDHEAEEYADLGKESGELEFTADCALVLVRDTDCDDRSKTWVAIAKSRIAPKGWVRPPLVFNGSRFDEEGVPVRSAAVADEPADEPEIVYRSAPPVKANGAQKLNGGRRG
jgi:replicative DNA helicase